MQKIYLTSVSTAHSKFTKELLIWNYWDHEHIVGTHFQHYKKVNILIENDNYCLSERWAKLPFVPFYFKEITFAILTNENQQDVFHYAFFNLIKSKQTFVFKEDNNKNCSVTRYDYFEVPKFLRFLQPFFDKIMKKWFVDVWNEDMPMRERRMKVWNLGFQDFKGINYINNPDIKRELYPNRKYTVELPLPKITTITKGGSNRLFIKSKHIGYGLPSL